MCALGLKGDNRKEIKKKRIGHNIADNIIYINVKIYYLKNRAGPGFYLFWSELASQAGRPHPLHILPILVMQLAGKLSSPGGLNTVRLHGPPGLLKRPLSSWPTAVPHCLCCLPIQYLYSNYGTGAVSVLKVNK